MNNIDRHTVDGFGHEWTTFDQTARPADELRATFEKYFSVFPWEDLPADAAGFDLGCGTGRWASFVAARTGSLVCVDASVGALAVARRGLRARTNCRFVLGSAGQLPFAAETMDFGYSLGVLHHTPDPQAGLRDAVAALKPGAPFLVYLYYAFDNRARWYGLLWRASDAVRRLVSALPYRLRLWLTSAAALVVYLPLARLAKAGERFGLRVDGWPLSAYRDRGIYAMRTDALDRFGTRLEQRFTRDEIVAMMRRAGLEGIQVAPTAPYWCAVGRKASPARTGGATSNGNG